MKRVLCPVCGDHHRVPETRKTNPDTTATCFDCTQKMESLHKDLYIRNQPERLRMMAEYVEAKGKPSKAGMLREFAETMEEYKSVVRGIEKWLSGDFTDLDDAIKR